MLSKLNIPLCFESAKEHTNTSQVKSQAGSRRDPANPTWDPASNGGIPPFPPGIKN